MDKVGRSLKHQVFERNPSEAQHIPNLKIFKAFHPGCLLHHPHIAFGLERSFVGTRIRRGIVWAGHWVLQVGLFCGWSQAATGEPVAP